MSMKQPQEDSAREGAAPPCSVAQTLVAALRRHQVDIIFAQSNPPSLLLAAERAGIRQVAYRTENSGGVMADGFARISRRIGVIAVQNGPAATLVVAPMSEAMKSSIPLLVLVQETPAEQRDRNAFQEFDHQALFASVSKWTRRIEHAARVDDYVDMAITAATSGRPGPVVLLLPGDVLDVPAARSRFARVLSFGTFPLDRVRPDPAAVAHAAELIANAYMPVAIVGGGIHISDAYEQLAELQRLANIPVATTNMGKGAVSETSDLSLGVAANITGKLGPAHFHLPSIKEADVVLLIGTRTNQNGTNSWSLTKPNAKYIHLDLDGMEVGRNYESVRLVGDVKAGLSDLNQALQSLDLTRRTRNAPALIKSIAEGRRRHLEAIEHRVTSGGAPIAPERLVAELDALIGPEDIVVADASYASMWVTGYLTAKRAGQRFLVPRGLAGLGWGLPLAIGAKLARPSAQVVAIVGDGGFAHVWSELETAVREQTALVVIVLNNAVLGMQRHGENLFWGSCTSAITLNRVDHAAIAQAVGAKGRRVSDPAHIRPALEEALAEQRLVVLDVMVDPNAHVAIPAYDGQYAKINAGEL